MYTKRLLQNFRTVWYTNLSNFLFVNRMHHNETDLPAKQEETSAHIRLSQTHENIQRTSSSQPPPQSGKKETDCIGHGFPKTLRLLSRFDYQRVFKERRRWYGKLFIIHYRPSPSLSSCRIGLTVSRQYGKSHDRNRFKRLLREAFRLHQVKLPLSFDLNILPQGKAKSLHLHEIESELKQFFSTLLATHESLKS